MKAGFLCCAWLDSPANGRFPWSVRSKQKKNPGNHHSKIEPAEREVHHAAVRKSRHTQDSKILHCLQLVGIFAIGYSNTSGRIKFIIIIMSIHFGLEDWSIFSCEKMPFKSSWNILRPNCSTNSRINGKYVCGFWCRRKTTKLNTSERKKTYQKCIIVRASAPPFINGTLVDGGEAKGRGELCMWVCVCVCRVCV